MYADAQYCRNFMMFAFMFYLHPNLLNPKDTASAFFLAEGVKTTSIKLNFNTDGKA